MNDVKLGICTLKIIVYLGIVQKKTISLCGFQAYTTQIEEIFVTYGSGMLVENISAGDVKEFIELSTSTDHSFIVNQVNTQIKFNVNSY